MFYKAVTPLTTGVLLFPWCASTEYPSRNYTCLPCAILCPTIALNTFSQSSPVNL